jgi:hypothetical protein
MGNVHGDRTYSIGDVMSWLDRLRGIRTEQSARVPSEFTSVKKGAPPTFVPDMIMEEIWERDNMAHVAKVARQDPIAARIVYMVAEKAIDDWFIIRTEDGEEHPDNREIQREFKRLRAKHYVIMSVAGERWGGHTWLQVINEKRTLTIDTEDSEQAPLRIAGLDFWTPEHATVYKYNEVNGAPETIKVTFQVGVAVENTIPKEEFIPAKDMILFRTRPFDRSHEGRGVLDAVWDYLVYLRYLFHAVTWYAMKVGLGVFHAKVRKLTKEKKAAMEAGMQDLSAKRFFLYDTDVEELGFIGASGGAINFDVYIDAILDEIAAGTDIPKVVLTGQEQGNISGGEAIEKALYSTINSIQQAIDPYIREIILRMHYDDSDMILDWNTRYAHDEKEEAEIEVSHVSAQVARLQYYKMNEVRELDGLEPVEGGDESPGKPDISIGVTGLEPPSKQEQTRNKEGVQI